MFSNQGTPTLTSVLFCMSVLAGASLAAEPPSLVNYQGVLRDSSDVPLDGDQDMVFTFFSSDVGGDAILVDRHTAGDGNPVTVTGGLFGVALGGGIVVDGAGPGTFGSLAEVFRDYGEVWVRIEIGLEALSPRVRVISAGYALNADHLDGSDSTFFLNTSGAAQEKTGLFVASGGVDFGPGGSDDLTASDVETLTSGASADLLHSHAAVGTADTLDGLDSAQFLRSDAEDAYTGGTLTIGAGTTLSVRGNLRANGSVYMDEDGPDANQYLYFYDDGSWVGEALYWDEADDRFQLTNDISSPRYFGTSDPTYYLTPDGFSHLDGLALYSNNLFLNYAGPDFTSRIFFYDDGAFNNESISWVDGADHFQFSNDVYTQAEMTASRFVDFSNPAFQVDPASTSTLNILEVNGGTLRMNPDGPETNSSILFYSGGVPDSEWIRWNVLNDRFDFSDNMSVAGQVEAYQFVDGSDDTYRLDPAATSTLNDLHLNGTHLWLNYDGPDASSGIRFYNAGSASAEYLQWDDTDERFEFSDDMYASTMHSTRYLDSSNSAFYLDPASTSVLNVAQFRGNYMYFNQDGPDGQVTLYFHDDGVSTNESIQWDDVNDYFEFSNDISISGDLRMAETVQVGSTALTPLTYSRFGTATPISGDMGNTGDLYLSNDIEVGQNAYVLTSIQVGDSAPTSGQLFSSIGDSGGKDETDINTTNDLYIGGSLEVDGWLYVGTRSSTALYYDADGTHYASMDYDNNSTASEYRWYHDGSFTGTSQLAEIQEDGDLRIRGTLYQNVTFDVAESFLAGEPLEPGDVVRVDPARPDGVLRTTGATDAGVIGVVSTDPGMVLGGAPFDTESLRRVWGDAVHNEFMAELPTIRAELLDTLEELRLAEEELKEFGTRIDTEREAVASLREAGETLATVPSAGVAIEDGLPISDPVAERISSLEAMEREAEQRRVMFEDDVVSLALERFCERRLVPVALAGRVPVKVDAEFGAVAPGDLLSPSPVPGVAMRADGTGPVIGTALEAFDAGQGRVLALVSRDHYAPGAEIASIQEEQADLAAEIDERTPDPITGTQSVPGHLQVVLDRDADDQARFSIFRDGENGLGAEVFRVDEDGNVFAKGAFSPASMDVAELFEVSESVEPGDVLVIDPATNDAYGLARESGDPTVIGVVAEDPGVLLGRGIERIAATDPEIAEELELARNLGDRKTEATLWATLEREFLRTHAPVAMSGTVPVKVDAGFGAIRRGDLLTSSPTPGHAMRADRPETGTVIGKALESLKTGTGTVRMLVMLR